MKNGVKFLIGVAYFYLLINIYNRLTVYLPLNGFISFLQIVGLFFIFVLTVVLVQKTEEYFKYNKN